MLTLDYPNTVAEDNEDNNQVQGTLVISTPPSGTPGEPSYTEWKAAAEENYFSTDTQTGIDTIVIHTTNGGSSSQLAEFNGAVSTFQNPNLTIPRSAHYVIRHDGHVVNMVALRHPSGHAIPRNLNSIGIEVAGNSGSSMSAPMWNTLNLAALRKLILYLKSAFPGIPLKHPTGNSTTSPKGFDGIGIIAHSQINAGKIDPGWTEQDWTTFMAKLLEEWKAGTAFVQPQAPPPSGGNSWAAIATSQSQWTVSLDSPYERIVTLQSSTDLVNWVTEESFVAHEGIEARTVQSAGEPAKFFRFAWGQ